MCQSKLRFVNDFGVKIWELVLQTIVNELENFHGVSHTSGFVPN